MVVKYCDAACQRNHWPTHKKQCKLRAAELRDEALFRDPPPKEDCPICFLPIPGHLFSSASLPPATISSVPIYDFANEHVEFAGRRPEEYYACCGKNICMGCIHSFCKSGNIRKCPFCNSERNRNAPFEEYIEQVRKRVEANDPGAICMLAECYQFGRPGIARDEEKAMELYARAADLGSSFAHCHLGLYYNQRGDLKKETYHYEAAAMAGHNSARSILGTMESESGNMGRAVKHWSIAASAGDYGTMHTLIAFFKMGYVSRESIDSTLAAYNTSCVEMRSEARDAYIRF